jgi:hypothetical protein
MKRGRSETHQTPAHANAGTSTLNATRRQINALCYSRSHIRGTTVTLPPPVEVRLYRGMPEDPANSAESLAEPNRGPM